MSSGCCRSAASRSRRSRRRIALASGALVAIRRRARRGARLGRRPGGRCRTCRPRTPRGCAWRPCAARRPSPGGAELEAGVHQRAQLAVPSSRRSSRWPSRRPRSAVGRRCGRNRGTRRSRARGYRRRRGCPRACPPPTSGTVRQLLAPHSSNSATSAGVRRGSSRLAITTGSPAVQRFSDRRVLVRVDNLAGDVLVAFQARAGHAAPTFTFDPVDVATGGAHEGEQTLRGRPLEFLEVARLGRDLAELDQLALRADTLLEIVEERYALAKAPVSSWLTLRAKSRCSAKSRSRRSSMSMMPTTLPSVTSGTVRELLEPHSAYSATSAGVRRGSSRLATTSGSPVASASLIDGLSY